MELDLRLAGWTKKMSHIWQAPNGALFLGPAGAWKAQQRQLTAQDQADRNNGRDRLLARGMRLRLEIEQTFIDTAHWNDQVRRPDEDPIDPDPDGQLRKLAETLDRQFAQESARKARTR